MRPIEDLQKIASEIIALMGKNDLSPEEAFVVTKTISETISETISMILENGCGDEGPVGMIPLFQKIRNILDNE